MIQTMTPPVNDDELYEVINGERVRKPMSNYENVMAGILFARLDTHATASNLGRALIEVMFDLPHVDNNRRPDVAFVSAARWPLNRRVPRQNAWAIVPELAAEVVSPTDDLEEVMDKVEEYFRAGVSLVWLVLPQQERVYVYTSPTAVQILSRSDDLTGDLVVPGFRLPLANLFPPPDPPVESTP